MKKLLLVLALVMAGLITYAQDCTSKANVPGSKDQVKVEYFRNGTMKVTNTAKVMVEKVHIKVTCEETYSGGSERGGKKVETIVLCDMNVSSLKPGEARTIKEGVRNIEKAPHGGTIGNFKTIVTDVKAKQSDVDR